jgi:hypothetical protein
MSDYFLSDVIKLFDATFIGKSEKIARLDPNDNMNLGVSTVKTTDMGYETALLLPNQTAPVERYDSLEQAVEGHAKWVKFAQELKGETIVTKLGYGLLVEDQQITVKKG